jgi:hypothetical protein
MTERSFRDKSHISRSIGGELSTPFWGHSLEPVAKQIQRDREQQDEEEELADEDPAAEREDQDDQKEQDEHVASSWVGWPSRCFGLTEATDDAMARARPVRRSLPDELVLEVAATERRILITLNASHFQPLSRSWMEEQRPHSGLMLIWTLQSNAFREIVAAIAQLLADRPAPADWRDLAQSI